MSLDISKLEHVRAHGRKITARCPACAETGHDQTRNHLIIQTDGRFGCVVYPGDSPEAREHRKRIFALCGNREIKPLAVRGSVLGRLGRADGSRSASEPLKSGLLGRLGRLFQTHSGTKRTHAGNEDRMTEELSDFERGVPSVLNTPATKSHQPRLQFCIVYSEALDQTIFLCDDEATKTALVEAGAAEWSIYTKDELRILVAQNRIAPLCATELRNLGDIKRTFNARITSNDFK